MTILRSKILFSLALTATIVLTTSTSALSALFEKSYAIVIGIDRYENNEKWQTLAYATKDARGMADFLQNQKFDEVTTLFNEEATRANILQAYNDVADMLQDGDRVLLFFSGHGETRDIGGQDFGYIIPYDGGVESDINWISMDHMHDISRKLDNARHQLFIFDSCYGGQFAGPRKAPLSSVPESHPRYIEKITANSARQYITAGGKDELVRANGPLGYSYFTGYLLEALEGAADLNADTYITTSELDAYLQPRASNWDHTPIAGVMPEHGQGNFWFRVPSYLNVAGQPSEATLRVLSALSPMKGVQPDQDEMQPNRTFLLTEIKGIGTPTAKKLLLYTLNSVERIASLTDDEIVIYDALIPGIGKISLERFRESAKALLNRSGKS